MELLLDDAARSAQARARTFVDRAVMPFAAEYDRDQRVPTEHVQALAAEGWLGKDISSEYGGGGLDPLSFGLTIEEFGRGCSSIRSLLTVHGMVTCALARWGSPAQRERFLPPFARGAELAALAFTEPSSGTDLSGVSTHAQAAKDGFTLSGHKLWITFGQLADWFLVLAQSAAGPVTLLVPRSAPGLRITPLPGPLGTRGSMLAELGFEACFVPSEQVLAKPGLGLSLVGATALDHGRFTVAWGCVGIMEACLRHSAEHAMQRKQFGAPLAEHQLIRRLLSDMTTSLRAARSLCLHAARLRAALHHDSVTETSVAKYFAAQAAMRAAADAVQIHGALGCQPGQTVERCFRDAKVMEIIEGTNEMHQLMIADLSLQDAAQRRGMAEAARRAVGGT